MKNYRKLIMSSLLESYEKSALFLGKNKNAQNIYYRFSKKTIPEYFEDTSVIYDEIHHELQALENMGLILIHWRNNKAGHIVDKVSLNLEKLEDAYTAAGKKKLQSEQDAFKEYLRSCDLECDVLKNFFKWLEDRIDQGLSVKAYTNISNLAEFDALIRGVRAVVGNTEECFIRELSMNLYGDSKKLEGLKRRIETIIVNFSSDKAPFANAEDIFLEFNVLKNPSIVMIKGDADLLSGKGRIS